MKLPRSQLVSGYSMQADENNYCENLKKWDIFIKRPESDSFELAHSVDSKVKLFEGEYFHELSFRFKKTEVEEIII